MHSVIVGVMFIVELQTQAEIKVLIETYLVISCGAVSSALLSLFKSEFDENDFFKVAAANPEKFSTTQQNPPSKPNS